MISITVNGKPRTLDGDTPLPDLLRALEVNVRTTAVAVNDDVVPRKDYDRTVLHDGDHVEIVRMVGGGADGGGPRVAGHGSRAKGQEGIVIAGAGIIGCAIAYELSRRDVASTVLDSRALGMAATNAAAGVLSPLAEFQRPGALVRLGLESLQRYPLWVDRLRQDVPDIDVEFVINGVLRVAFDEAELAEYREGLRYRDELGVELLDLDRTLVREIEPRLSDRIVGGVLSPQEGQVSNQLFTLALARAAKKRGTRVVEFAPVERFRRRGDRVVAVRTAHGEIECEQLVLAAGPWTRQLARKLDVEVPVRPVRGQMLALGRMVTPIGRPVWGKRGYVLPRANGIVFAGATVEEAGFRNRTTQRGLASVRRAAFELVPQLRHAREHFSWAGLRPGSPDGLPMLGRLPGWSNVWLASGHFRNGILLAPVTGELMADALVEGRTDVLSPYDPARFLNA